MHHNDGQNTTVMDDKTEKAASKLRSFRGTLIMHKVRCVFSKSILGLFSKCTTLTMRRETGEHFDTGNVSYDQNPRWRVYVFTGSNWKNDPYTAELTPNMLTKAPLGEKQSWNNTGNYVRERFLAKHVEYWYATVNNEIDEEINDLCVTFLKICDDKVKTFERIKVIFRKCRLIK